MQMFALKLMFAGVVHMLRWPRLSIMHGMQSCVCACLARNRDSVSVAFALRVHLQCCHCFAFVVAWLEFLSCGVS